MCCGFLVHNIVVKLYVLLERFAHRFPLFVHQSASERTTISADGARDREKGAAGSCWETIK